MNLRMFSVAVGHDGGYDGGHDIGHGVGHGGDHDVGHDAGHDDGVHDRVRALVLINGAITHLLSGATAFLSNLHDQPRLLMPMLGKSVGFQCTAVDLLN